MMHRTNSRARTRRLVAVLVGAAVAASGVAVAGGVTPAHAAFQIDDGDTDNGISVSAEGYKEIEKNLYLGVEAGYTNVDGKVNLSGTRVDSDIVFLPIELNLKYAIRITQPNCVEFFPK